jgi:hypothetical protein
MTPANRREFLKHAAALPAVWAAAQSAAVPAAQPATTAKLPQMQFGRHLISHLICGSNPFNAGSHLSVFVNQEMRSYFTPEQILKTLRRCLEVGINCWQMSGVQGLDLYRRLVDEGAPLRLISLTQKLEELPLLKEGGCLGVAHHGEVTDKLFKAGRLEEVQAFLKRIRDTGMLVGVSTHMPAVVDAIESKGWDLDYYMTCVYERHRSREDLEKLLGHAPIPVGEVYLSSDPPRMFKAVQHTRRPCLAFKILAAGRLSDRKQSVEQAFRETLAGIKPSDGVIVGMYDRYSDQPAENAELVRRFGSGKQKG